MTERLPRTRAMSVLDSTHQATYIDLAEMQVTEMKDGRQDAEYGVFLSVLHENNEKKIQKKT